MITRWFGKLVHIDYNFFSVFLYFYFYFFNENFVQFIQSLRCFEFGKNK